MGELACVSASSCRKVLSILYSIEMNEKLKKSCFTNCTISTHLLLTLSLSFATPAQSEGVTNEEEKREKVKVPLLVVSSD